MCLHDLIVKEFEQTKSLSALIYLIEHGREIEFLFEGRKYFLSHSNSQKKVSLWSNKEVSHPQSFIITFPPDSIDLNLYC